MPDNLLRPQLLPVLISNLCSMYGVMILGWSIADVFFWFWYEFALAGLTSFVLVVIWSTFGANRSNCIVRTKPFLFAFSFLMILFYATLFAGMAYMGEWKNWYRFPEFIADKHIQMLATLGSFVFFFTATIVKSDYGEADCNRIELQFGRRSMVVLGLYAFLQVQYYYVNDTHLNLTSTYLKNMGAAMLTLKALAEAGLLDRFFKKRAAA